MNALLLACFSLFFAVGDTFTNPVDQSGQDPWVVKHDGTYYEVFATGPSRWRSSGYRNAVWVRGGTKSLLGVFDGEEHKAWAPPRGTAFSEQLWAPELHRLNGAWYLYVAADDGDNANHRMHVLRRNASDPRGDFEHLGELELPDDKWAIDGTPMEYNGQLYFIWSGWPGDENTVQNLYICRLKDPATAIGERVMISTPQLEWEKRPNDPNLPLVNEGPTAVQMSGKTFVTYAASGSWTDDYCTGLLELTGNDPMDPKAWKKHDTPLLASGNGLIAPGHAGVVKSPDDREWWLVFHSAKYPGAGWSRQVNLLKLGFDEKRGVPIVEHPTDSSQPIAVPSGDTAREVQMR